MRTLINPLCGIVKIPARTFFIWNFVGVAVIVERGAESKITDAGLEYRAAFQLTDLGL